jgi:hypothetical protein
MALSRTNAPHSTTTRRRRPLANNPRLDLARSAVETWHPTSHHQKTTTNDDYNTTKGKHTVYRNATQPQSQFQASKQAQAQVHSRGE